MISPRDTKTDSLSEKGHELRAAAVSKSGASRRTVSAPAFLFSVGVLSLQVACGGGGAVVIGAPAVAPAASPPERATPDIALREARVFLDGMAFDPAPPGKVVKAEKLFNALMPRAGRWKGEGVRTYTLTLDGQADGGQMKSLVRTAAGAGWPVATMGAGDSLVTIQSELYGLGTSIPPSPPGASPPLQWPDQPLTIVIRGGAVELWRVAQPKSSAQPRPAAQAPDPASEPAPTKPVVEPLDPAPGAVPPDARPAPKSVATRKAANVPVDLPGLIETECSGDSPCSPAILYLASDASAALIGQVLEPLAKQLRKRGQTSLVQLRFDEPAAEGPPPNASAEAIANASPNRGTKPGRLPPEVVLKAVRARFGSYRLCYEDGLRRDRDLTGKITIRFVIGVDGKISAANADEWQSNMPDAEVTKCVLQQIREAVFPAPEGGIVTVVYPIMFAPGN